MDPDAQSPHQELPEASDGSQPHILVQHHDHTTQRRPSSIIDNEAASQNTSNRPQDQLADTLQINGDSPDNINSSRRENERGRPATRIASWPEGTNLGNVHPGAALLRPPESGSPTTSRRPPTSRRRSRGRPDYWSTVLGKVRRKIRVERAKREAFSRPDRPCLKCESMKLTRSKFLIQEYLPTGNGLIASTQVMQEQREVDQEERGLEIGDSEFELGTLREIVGRSRTCPFCRLIISSLREHKEAFGRGMAYGERIVDEVDEGNAKCTATWQVDGRVLAKMGHSLPRTRRIRIHYSWPGYQDSYIVLMSSGHSWASDGLFLGRTIESARINPALIQKWVNLCTTSHGNACAHQEPKVIPPPSYFGVVDVSNMCLTPLPKGERYLALSYVWGGLTFYTARLSNIQALRKPGGISRILDQLPHSIQDAIALAKELGEKYLWVDALCVVQDSSRSWELNSEVMDLVYGNAFLTICAADGINANAGLKALRADGTFLEQNIERFSGDIRLMSTHPAEAYIKASVWHTQDENARWSIELVGAPTPKLFGLYSQPVKVFADVVHMYTSRSLSKPEDILAAFKGIGNRVCTALGGSLTQGLPSSHFDWALLWEAHNAPERRGPTCGGESFPSWSWCGWKGEVMEYKPHIVEDCQFSLHDWLMDHTWIVWYIRDIDGNLRLVWNGPEEGKYPEKQTKWLGYKYPPQSSEEYDAYGRFIPEERRHLTRDNFQLTLPDCPYGVTITDRHRKPGTPDRPYLQFFTWSAYLKLRRDPTISQQGHGQNFRRYSILDKYGDWCGTIVLDKKWTEDTNAEREHSHEFLAISEARNFQQNECDGWTYYVPLDRESSEWDLFYVLLVQRKEIVVSGYIYTISERVGLGKVFKYAFDRSCHVQGKKWSEILLT
ncbi:MAG: hypothetical protein M1820_005162 [Bogoriella megaspora]|nr:MAG: hypothetical protein M1820_005162 [Bogoriella megaspora]